MLIAFTTFLLSAVIVSAVPAAVPGTTKATTTAATPTAFCSAVNSLVTSAKAQSAATAYCSSFLSITPVVTTLPATRTTTVFPATLSCSSNDLKDREADPEADPDIELNKRTVAKPSCFKSYTASNVISSACSCLKIPTPTIPVGGVATQTTTNFIIRAGYNQNYAVLTTNSNLPGLAFTDIGRTDALVFSLQQQTCQLQTGSNYAGPQYRSAYIYPGFKGESGNPNDHSLLFDSNYGYEKSNRQATPVTCTFSASRGDINCQDAVGDLSTRLDDDTWLVGDGSSGGGVGSLFVEPFQG